MWAEAPVSIYQSPALGGCCWLVATLESAARSALWSQLDEAPDVLRWALECKLVLGRHGVRGLEGWTGAQRATDRRLERHVPRLDEPHPWVVARSPWHPMGSVGLLTVATAITAAAATAARVAAGCAAGSGGGVVVGAGEIGWCSRG